MVYGVGALIEPPILSLFEKTIAHLGEHLPSTGFLYHCLRGILQGLSGGVAIVLPYLLPFLIGMAVLEDIGYLPRVAFLMDALCTASAFTERRSFRQFWGMDVMFPRSWRHVSFSPAVIALLPR